MCEITKCSDLIDSKNRFNEFSETLKESNPKIFNKLKPLLEELNIFMGSAISHLDLLYIDVLQNKDSIENMKTGNLKISFENKLPNT